MLSEIISCCQVVLPSERQSSLMLIETCKKWLYLLLLSGSICMIILFWLIWKTAPRRVRLNINKTGWRFMSWCCLSVLKVCLENNVSLEMKRLFCDEGRVWLRELLLHRLYCFKQSSFYEIETDKIELFCWESNRLSVSSTDTQTDRQRRSVLNKGNMIFGVLMFLLNMYFKDRSMLKLQHRFK